jgi:hypothetical protein
MLGFAKLETVSMPLAALDTLRFLFRQPAKFGLEGLVRNAVIAHTAPVGRRT